MTFIVAEIGPEGDGLAKLFHSEAAAMSHAFKAKARGIVRVFVNGTEVLQ